MCHMSAAGWLTLYTEKSENRVKFERERASLSACIVLICAILMLDKTEEKVLYVPLTGGWYHLTGHE